MIAYGNSIVQRLQNESLLTVAENPDLHDLVYYRLLCISEAVRNILRLDHEISERHPEIPWVAVRALGNVLRHQYGDIDAETIWQTYSRGDIALLITAAEADLALRFS